MLHNDDVGDIESMVYLSIFTYLRQAFDPQDNSQFLKEDEYFAVKIYVLMNRKKILLYIE